MHLAAPMMKGLDGPSPSSRSAWLALMGLTLLSLLALIPVRYASEREVWDAGRLVPTVAFWRGLPVYSDDAKGCVQTTMYPPAAIVAYSPAALGRTPNEILLLGRVVAVVLAMAAPVAWCLTIRREVLPALVGASAFACLAWHLAPLRYACFSVHADAPGLGFAAAACLAAFRSCPHAPRALPLAALLAVLSTGSKQTFVPLLPALAAWIGASSSFRSMLRFVGWTLGLGSMLGLCAIVAFGWAPLWFNLVVVPARCPWVGPASSALGRASWELIRSISPLVLAALGAVGFLRRLPVVEGSPPAGRAEVLLLWVSAALFPLSVLGRVKVGGAENTLSPALYFAALSACVALTHLVSRLQGLCLAKSSAMRVGVRLGLAASMTFLGAETASRVVRSSPHRQSRLEAVYHRLRERPGSGAYFPDYPLAHLCAEDRYYHFAPAVRDRHEFGGVPLSATQRKEFFPTNPKTIYWTGSWGCGFVRSHYFSEYLSAPPDLEGFTRYMPREAVALASRQAFSLVHPHFAQETEVRP